MVNFSCVHHVKGFASRVWLQSQLRCMLGPGGDRRGPGTGQWLVVLGLAASDWGLRPVRWHCSARQSEGRDTPPPSSHGSALALQEQRFLEEASRVRHHREPHGGAHGSVLPQEAPPVGIHPAVPPAPPALDPPRIIQHLVRLPWVNLGGRTNGEGTVHPETSHLSRDVGHPTLTP